MLLSAVFLTIIGGHAFEVIEKREDWPFSSYSMFSAKRRSVLRRSDVVGVGPAGEFEIVPATHFAPFDNTRFQRALSLTRDDTDTTNRQADAAEALVRMYDASRAAGLHSDPPLLGLRSYELSWRLMSGAQNRATPDTRKLVYYLYLPPAALSERLRRAASGELSANESAVRHHHAPNDLVVGAREIVTAPGIARVDDADAAVRFGWSFASSGSSDDSASATVVAAARRYTLWLRGKTIADTTPGSLRVEVTSGGALHCDRDAGFGNWHDAFPAGAFAWSSAAPGAPPCVVDASGGPLTMKISARAGTVVLDQVWLATEQPEAPTFAGAVAASTPRLATR